MKFFDTMTKIKAFFNLFKKNGSAEQLDGSSEGKRKRIVLIVSLVLTGILLVVGAALLIRKLKQRRLEKEAKQALDDYYSTDFDADEYIDEEDDEDVVRF